MKSEFRSDQRSRFPLGAILITGVTSVVLAGVTAAIVSSKSAPLRSAGLPDKDVKEIAVRLERLERHHARDSDSGESTAVVQGEPTPESAAIDDDMRIIRQRLAQLENIENARRETDRQQAERIDFLRRNTEVYSPETAAQVISDASANDEMKAIAWRSMRNNAAEAWTDQAVMEAVRIGATATDPTVRADIWRQAHANHTHSLLLQPLLQALGNDPDRRVREEAAETLDLYLDEYGVRDALQIAAEYDTHPNVRRQAQSSLKGPDTGF